LTEKIAAVYSSEKKYHNAAREAHNASQIGLSLVQSPAVIQGCGDALSAANHAYAAHLELSGKSAQALRAALATIAESLEDLQHQAQRKQYLPKLYLASAFVEAKELLADSNATCSLLLTQSGRQVLSDLASLSADLSFLPSLSLLNYAADRLAVLASRAGRANAKFQPIYTDSKEDVERAVAAWTTLLESHRSWATDQGLRSRLLSMVLQSLAKRCPIPKPCMRKAAELGEDPSTWILLSSPGETSPDDAVFHIADGVPEAGASVRLMRCLVGQTASIEVDKPDWNVEWTLPAPTRANLTSVSV
jgi:hypothetical protein